LTKGDLVGYYRRVAEVMLPHVRGRPLSTQRLRGPYTEGAFFQQDWRNLPEGMPFAEVPKRGGGTVRHPVVEEAEHLEWLANQNAFILHGWASRLDDLERPDELIIDLDPPTADFAPVRKAARLTRALLDELGLRSYPMATGSKGVHVVVPLDRSQAFDEVKAFGDDVGRALVERAPKELTRAAYKSQRKDRLFVDTGRVARGHTAIVPYSVRAREHASVAAPLEWDEVFARTAPAHRWTVANLFRRLARRSDPWADIWSDGQSLEAATERLRNA
jgi:bifunctional non-homologous end joining protein LigD